jgi:hypothetical protein
VEEAVIGPNLSATGILPATNAATIILGACSTSGATRNAAKLDVSAAPAVADCATTSPEIQVYNTPSRAVKYVVTLRDLNQPDSDRGRGEASVNPAGIIPAGTLEDFQGPCSSQGSGAYRYDVQALASGGEVLGTGSYNVTM